MIRIELVGDDTASLRGDGVEDRERLWAWREDHAFLVPNHDRTKRFKSGSWDGKRWPGKWHDGRLIVSRGLARRIALDLDLALSSVMEAADATRWLESTARFAELRDYQIDAFRDVLTEGWARAAMATNAGKGAIIALLSAWARRRGHPVLIVCDELSVRGALVEQIEEWSDLREGRDLHVLKGQKIPEPGVTLAMVQALARRTSKNAKSPKEWKRWIGQHAMVIVDEADKATAPSWRRVLKAAVSSRWRVGLSGSFPERADSPFADLLLDEIIGPIVARERNRAMIARGVSARVTVELVTYDVSDVLTKGVSSWPKRYGGVELRNIVYDQAITHNVDRHAYVASLITPDTPTVIVVNRVAHGRSLSAAIRGSVYLDGSASGRLRQRVLDAFQERKVDVLIVTKILDRGSNRLGHATDIIFASGEGSKRQTLQRVGRGLRRTDGKEFLRLVDVVDRVDLTRHRRFNRAAQYLHGAAQRRLELYATEGFEVKIVTP